MPKSVSLESLEHLFQATVLRMLVSEGLLAEQMSGKLLFWRHTGFNYYSWYSNKARGVRLKREATKVSKGKPPPDLEVIDVTDYQAKSVPSKKWRTLIRKVWKVDPLLCLACGGKIRIMPLIDAVFVIEKILRHFGLWEEEPNVGARPPPAPEVNTMTVEPYLEDLPYGEWGAA